MQLMGEIQNKRYNFESWKYIVQFYIKIFVFKVRYIFNFGIIWDD